MEVLSRPDTWKTALKHDQAAYQRNADGSYKVGALLCSPCWCSSGGTRSLTPHHLRHDIYVDLPTLLCNHEESGTKHVFQHTTAMVEIDAHARRALRRSSRSSAPQTPPLLLSNALVGRDDVR